MSDKKVKPSWCKLLPVVPFPISATIECYVSDTSEGHALEEKMPRTIVSYNDDARNGYNFTTIEDIVWKFAVPVVETLRSPSQEQKESRALKLIKDLKDTLSNQITALEKEISEWSTEPAKTTSWCDKIPSVGVKCRVSDPCSVNLNPKSSKHGVVLIVRYEPGIEYPYISKTGSGWKSAVPVDPKLRDSEELT